MSKRISQLLVGALFCTVVAFDAVAQQGTNMRDQVNKGTVGIISGGIGGTYIRIATDLANVLDNREDLRVLPIMGKGSVQNIDDILYLRGIDIGIVQSDVFAYVKRVNKHPTIDQRIHYITKLYNEEFHLLAGKDIKSIDELAGKKVNFGVQGSGTYMTASLVFETLGLNVEPVSFDQALAMEKVKSGEVAALVYVAGKPASLFKSLRAEDKVHLLEVPLTPEILTTYLPSRFRNEDYPQLVQPGQQVKTLAVGAVMAVYNWEPGTLRYEKVANFVDSFFERFDDFQKPPRHSKWREVSLTAVVPGWTRFEPAETWLKKSAIAGSGELKTAFDAFLKAKAPSLANRLASDQEKEELFNLFLLWQSRYTP